MIDNMREKLMMPNCKDCHYRKTLARFFDIHVDHRDCDKVNTYHCLRTKQLPAHNLDGPKPDHVSQDQGDRMKENFRKIYENEEG